MTRNAGEITADGTDDADWTAWHGHLAHDVAGRKNPDHGQDARATPGDICVRSQAAPGWRKRTCGSDSGGDSTQVAVNG